MDNNQKLVDIIVGVPSGISVSSRFFMDMIALQSALFTSPIEGYKVNGFKVLNQRGSILPQLRQKIAEGALELKGTHLLFIDSDMGFPRDLLHRWIPMNVPVVAANCGTKKIPCCPTARQWKSDTPQGFPVFTTRKNKSLERVWRVGTGVMLINLEVFSRIEKPWFPIHYDTKHKDYIGEDWGFCRLLEKANIPIYVDHAASWEIKHMGETEYGHDIIEMQGYARELHAQAEKAKLTAVG